MKMTHTKLGVAAGHSHTASPHRTANEVAIVVSADVLARLHRHQVAQPRWRKRCRA